MTERGPSGEASTARSRHLAHRLLHRLGIDLRPGEGRSAVLFFLFFFLVITFQYATKSVRQSTFIDSLGAARLPWAYLAVAVVSYPVLRLYAAGVDRIRRHHLVALSVAVVAATMVLFRGLFSLNAAWVAVVFYVWISIVYVMLPSQFWSFANQVYQPRQARRLFGFIGAGGLLGGVAGGQVARWGTAAVGTRNSLLVAALILLAVGAVVFWIHRSHPPEAGDGGAAGLERLESARGGAAVLGRSRLLRLLAIVLTLTVVVAQVVDLQFSWAVEQATTSLDQRTAFFGNFYSIMGVAAFLFQLTFTARIHRSLGVGVALAVLPVTMALGTGLLFVAAALVPGLLLFGAGVLKVGENGLRYSLDQASRELLFMPVPARLRLKAKAFIDVFVQRGAKGVAALLLLPVALALITPLEAGWLTLSLVVVWLFVLVRLRRAYVAAFREGLRERRMLTPVPLDLTDTTTLEMLVESLASPDPRRVEHAIRFLMDHGKPGLVSPLLLQHEVPEVRRLTLQALAAAHRHEQIAHVERALGDPEPIVRKAAVATLAHLASGDLDELMRPHLKEADPAVRGAAIAALASRWDLDLDLRAALAELVSDASPRARQEGARALAELGDPDGREELMRLARDHDSGVAAAALIALRDRMERDGFQSIYLPLLVAKLDDRHVKHEAREALVACGPESIPALAHFMRDPDESIWIRRALPRTLSRIGAPEVPGVLSESLDEERDPMLRRKLLEGLSEVRPALDGTVRARLQDEVTSQATICLQAMADLEAMGFRRAGSWRGPVPIWNEATAPSLLQRLLEERVTSSLRDLFALLALIADSEPMWGAWRSLTRGDLRERQVALEYLDNALTDPVRTNVLLIVGDTPLEDRFQRASTLLEIRRDGREELLLRLLGAASEAREDQLMLAEAALYTVRVERIGELIPAVREVASRDGGIVGETARWVLKQLGDDRSSARMKGER